MKTNCDFMETYKNVVRSVDQSVSIGINRKYSMVDATNAILKLTIIDVVFVMVCGRDIFAGSVPTFGRIILEGILMIFYTRLPSS